MLNLYKHHVKRFHALPPRCKGCHVGIADLSYSDYCHFCRLEIWSDFLPEYSEVA